MARHEKWQEETDGYAPGLGYLVGYVKPGRVLYIGETNSYKYLTHIKNNRPAGKLERNKKGRIFKPKNKPYAI